jgi:hypothetical protein
MRKVKFLGRIPADSCGDIQQKQMLEFPSKKILALTIVIRCLINCSIISRREFLESFPIFPEMSAIVRNYRVGRILAEKILRSLQN